MFMLIKYMLGNIYIQVYITGRIFPRLSISLFCFFWNPSCLISKRLRRKDFSMEQLPIYCSSSFLISECYFLNMEKLKRLSKVPTPPLRNHTSFKAKLFAAPLLQPLLKNLILPSMKEGGGKGVFILCDYMVMWLY